MAKKKYITIENRFQATKKSKKDKKELLYDSELSDDSIENYYSKLTKGNREDIDESKEWGNRAKDYYGSNQIESNPENFNFEYRECEKLRARLDSYMTEDDYLKNITVKPKKTSDVALVIEFMKEKYTKTLQEIAKNQQVVNKNTLILIRQMINELDGMITSRPSLVLGKITSINNAINNLTSKSPQIPKDEISKESEGLLSVPQKVGHVKRMNKSKKRKSGHPRVKYRKKSDKKLRKHQNMVKPIKFEINNYAGEKSGIRKNIIHSVKLY